jgi:hypothetical protein
MECWSITGPLQIILLDMLEFFPQHVKMPHLSTSKLVIQAAHELTFALRNPAAAAHFAHIGHDQNEALDRLKKLKEIADTEPPEEDAQRPAEAPIVMPSRSPEVPNIAHSPSPETAPSVMPSRITIAGPIAKPTCAPYKSVAAPSPIMGTPHPRVPQPSDHSNSKCTQAFKSNHQHS